MHGGLAQDVPLGIEKVLPCNVVLLGITVVVRHAAVLASVTHTVAHPPTPAQPGQRNHLERVEIPLVPIPAVDQDRRSGIAPMLPIRAPGHDG